MNLEISRHVLPSSKSGEPAKYSVKALKIAKKFFAFLRNFHVRTDLNSTAFASTQKNVKPHSTFCVDENRRLFRHLL